ncbi:esterase/lipase family protein [Labedaea rhizosphaerae]|uniref:Lipase (Class 2) n=1 Tax=Labedaea rhizosphaerae TaxID=598644 RepID=A0A4R6RYF9_LABRH|nr:alpha/beta fold hydrolase [Labedaea rhizosphaerae]TDP91904.1 lipase (class 2) [Labedaea rhizosphaerae]
MRTTKSGSVARLAAAAAALTAIAGIMTSTAGHAAGATRHYPVPYTFAANVLGAAHPYSDPPGSNDWSCRPGSVHPRPVVLVHGFASVMNDTWQTYSPLLANEGYCVFALNYGVPDGTSFPLDQVGGRTPLEDSAQELAAFVDRVRTATGVSQVDIVGHSEGTQMPNYYLKRLGGSAHVHTFVALAPFWRGTNAAGLATATLLAGRFGYAPVVNGVLDPLCAACRQLLAGSDYYAAFGDPVVPGVNYTSIVTRYDELAVPYTSGIASGMHNITLQDQCLLDHSEHFAILSDPVAGADILNALDPAHPRPVPCVYVPPFLG